MPLIAVSDYRPPFWLQNAHALTMYSVLFRRVQINYQRERINTPDGDFLDIDWIRNGSKNVVVILHGLGGSAEGIYVKGMAQAFVRRGWDVAAMNFRGASGEPNKLPKWYHAGATEDLETVVQHIIQKYLYKKVALVGFSLGGNMVLKYVGEKGAGLHPPVYKAAALSVPCDLAACSDKLNQAGNFIYMWRFMQQKREGAKRKAEVLKAAGYDPFIVGKMKNLREFDEAFTAPVHGFKNAEEYYSRSSARQYIPGVKIPTLLISAQDDPFLTPACFPIEEAREHEHFSLEMPEKGGHVGFVQKNADGEYWSEKRITDFIIGR